MMPLADLLVRVYVLVDDALSGGTVPVPRRPVARLRNRIETTIGELTERLGSARHGAKTLWVLLARAAATILAHTLLRLAAT